MNVFNRQWVICLTVSLLTSTSSWASDVQGSNKGLQKGLQDDLKNIVNYYTVKNDDVKRFLTSQDKENPLRGKDLKAFFTKEKISLKAKMPKLSLQDDKILLEANGEKLFLESVTSKNIQIKNNDKTSLVKSNMTAVQMKEALFSSKASALAVIVSLELFDVAAVMSRTKELNRNLTELDSWCKSKSYSSLTDDDRKVLLDYIHKLFDLQLRCDKVATKDPVLTIMCETDIPKTVGCYEVLLKGPRSK